MQNNCNWKFTFQYKCKIIAKFCYPKSSKFLLSDTNKMQFHGKQLQLKVYIVSQLQNNWNILLGNGLY